ncbi:hypothetical protein P175DRAFT_0301442 [Aspergillus ochraceoroseus IBT 24754]|uniref:Histone deacetylase complex subunit SAP30 Sin3 binding domain-containing protein n=3 Tax=Aspergillus subgen. Nidulantes TaxID=2720870 RepID=A0A0F8U460_9EURO|nr:uncharacterized protein P175DRAFT_0301442 [Aspergillus ochraceoroseus IBT 24754]KKK14534.1 hypothetical protein ARAM_006844 [Aspergillus rambellii]KKK19705.1 hypothetical protein AOCH_007637 [Aspergillus ochraceoroseus]PTU19431.1 hypothetical protein P175DRAFT_0301442 [Aspergillus ochraceoroseus IBT 24754]
MAPPRQRVHDDSRSEASSTTTKELKTGGAKGRKAANGGVAAAALSSREAKVAANSANVTSAPAAQAESADSLPRITWSEMPLEFLHSYRHAYKLTSPSAFSSEYAHNLLSRGIGLRSPTAIAAQRAHLSKQEPSQKTNGSSSSAQRHSLNHKTNTPNGISGSTHARSKKSSVMNGKPALNHIIGQDRVGKKELATAVRKHFNSAGLMEQEAIARFLYKVREEGRGRHFRLKFQP